VADDTNTIHTDLDKSMGGWQRRLNRMLRVRHQCMCVYILAHVMCDLPASVTACSRCDQAAVVSAEGSAPISQSQLPSSEQKTGDEWGSWTPHACSLSCPALPVTASTLALGRGRWGGGERSVRNFEPVTIAPSK
jgi:hypothetical protein